jgi:hypothetical protein
MERTVGVVPLARNRAHEEPSNKPVKTSTASTATVNRRTKHPQSADSYAVDKRAILRDAVDNELVVVDIARLAGDE